MSKRRVLVTGGAGFIGSNLIKKLLEKGDEIIAVDNFDPFYDRAIKDKNIEQFHNSESFRFIEADICDLNLLEEQINEPIDIIVHLAAKAGVRPSIKDPLAYQQVNVTGTQNLLEFARKREITQFVFASSSSVYGKNPNVPWREDDHVLQPISPYASTKVSGELLGHVYSHLYDMRFIALRFFTVYGPGQRPDLAIHKFFKLMSEGKEIPVFGKGDSRRDYTFIDDIVNGIERSMTYTDSNYEVINLGNNQTVTLSELISAIEKVSGLVAVKRFEPEQPGDVKQTWADVSKAQRLLGYNPETDIDQGLKKFSEWFVELNKTVNNNQNK